MKEFVTLKASKEAHGIISGISKLTGLKVQMLVDIAIKNLENFDFSEIKRIKANNENQFNKAIEKLSKDLPTTTIRSKNISQVNVHIDSSMLGGSKDPTDPLDIMIKDTPIGKPKHEIKLTMPDKAATRVDEALSNSNGLAPELDIDDLLSTEE